ncbi:hypothetical protein [Roseateles sp.]|uniref:hypothetical protein n=1 Tax=Roseateles sp. TaxID=1971397 RepID=UPI00326355D5
MTLEPKHPPGRANRKALRFSGDIRRLRNAGYTFSAIQTALLDAGVEVSLTTVKREAARQGSDPIVTQPHGIDQHMPSAPLAIAGAVATSSSRSSSSSRGASSREVAEAFFNANPSNPLFPVKESS